MKIETPIRLEFGNPEHIKLASEGYVLGKAIEQNLTGELEHDEEECSECGGSGKMETYYCSNCGNESDEEEGVIFTEWQIKNFALEPSLLNRCKQCKALLS